MTKFKHIITAALALAITFTLSCSDSSGGGSDPIKKARITGVSQKGPFVEGSKAVLYELNDGFAQTGRSFTDIIADNKGTFEIKNIEIVSPYAMFEASGYYRNENTGGISKSPITLFAIADVREKDQINVNILTHLEYYRVLNLAEQGKTVKEAKKQAQKEIFAVFGIDSDAFKDSEDMSIFGSTESDAALLAISVLLQGDLSEGEFSQRLTNFSQAIKTGGVWNNKDAKDAMAGWAFLGKNHIRNNILEWGLSSTVPSFEKYVYDYGVREFNLGECSAGNEWIVKKPNVNVNLLFDSFVCKSGIWKIAFPIDLYCYERKNCEILIDPSSGNKYRTQIRGTKNQTWMIEPLRYTDGPLKYDGASNEGEIAYFSLSEALVACPAGWRLPNHDEIEAIIPIGEPCHFGNISDDHLPVSMSSDGTEVGCSNLNGWQLENYNRNFGIVYCVKN